MKTAVELLSKYSHKSIDECQAVYAKYGNDFWKALYWLTVPDPDPDVFYDQLSNAPLSNSSLLIKLNEYFNNTKVTKAWLEFDETSQFPHQSESIKDTQWKGSEKARKTYLSLLEKYENYNVKLTQLLWHLIDFSKVTPLDERFFKPLQKLLDKHYVNTDYVLQLLISKEFKNHVPQIIPQIKLLLGALQSDSADLHFTILRKLLFFVDGIYPDLIPPLKILAKKGKTATVREWANELLVKYGAFTEEEIVKKKQLRREQEIKKIHTSINKIRTAKRLHEFAANFNWDDDVEYMYAVVLHPECDANTAREVYWNCQPHFYTAHASEEEVPDYERKDFRLLKLIEERIAANVYKTEKIPFLIGDERGVEILDDDMLPKEERKWEIPDYMYPEVTRPDYMKERT